MAENKERDEQEPEKIVEEIAEDKGEKEETVEDLTKDVADEISKMVKAEVEKSTAGVRKALADDSLGGDKETKPKKKAKTAIEWVYKFYGLLDEEGEEWWHQ